VRVTGELRNECPECRGMGYTNATCAVMRLEYSQDMGGYVELETLQQGSGCPCCLGTGQLP
jgi:hypothetical protein